MPFRKTDKGWFWGSSGPFKTKQKAIQVARAAHASGYKEEAESEFDVPSFALNLLHTVTNAHILHLRATSFAIHSAMGEFYSSLEDLSDSFIEAYQGRFEKIEDYGSEYEAPDEDPIDFVLGFMEYLDFYRKQIVQDSYLQNIIDEITQETASTLNKLKYYK